MSTPAAASPTVERQEIDRVLSLRRKHRESKACYPCRVRKVKCDRGQPCKTCRKRDHPEICTYDLQNASPRAKAPRWTQASRVIPTPRPVQDTDSSRVSPSGIFISSPTGGAHALEAQAPSPLPDSPNPIHNDGSVDYGFSGDNSLVSILRQQDPNGSMTREATSILGLHNTYASYPFNNLKTPEERWKALVEVVPNRDEVLKFFHFYRVFAYPFNPLLIDIEKFEVDICSYLSAYASGELQDADKISPSWSSAKSVCHISLLLATLAAGAHFSDLENPRRSGLCQDFTHRSFQALRLANFLFRPSFDSIQALLILGNTLQNNGQSDAAWALLGTTVRLTQTLGLHSEKSISHWPECLKRKAKSLWSMVVWQDSLLSLCYDRPPIATKQGWALDVSAAARLNLSYADIMHYLCQLGLDITRTADRRDSLDLLTALDNTYGRAQDHLLNRDQCKNLQQHLEHLALRVHVSFCISVLCRPAIRSSSGALGDPGYDHMRARARESLISASKAFLDFQALSIVPLRTWSMVHTVLSSTLLLCIWHETREDPECRELQQKVIEVFSSVNSAAKDSSSSSDYSQWLSARHIRALITLRNEVRKVPFPTSSGEGNNEPREVILNAAAQPVASIEFNQDSVGIPADPLYNGYFSNIDHLFPDGLNGCDANFSPVTYLESIMNFPLVDFPDASWE